MIMCVLLCYPVSIRIYYQQGVLFLVISRRALAREGDYEMMPVCACVRVCVRACVCACVS